MNESAWYKDAIFYEVYVRAFCDSNKDGHGDLPGLAEKLDYLQSLGINCLWLLPIYPSPLKDDGYDIADYYNILPAYGTIDDLKHLLDGAHARGIRVIADLVLNHTSDQHPWFQSARQSKDSPYRDYYVWSDTDQKYSQARIIFLDTEISNWTYDTTAGQYYWHRFYASQPDLNYDNPAVRQEMLNIMKFWLDLGVDGFRADAVPYLFEREGTNCENLPETHAFLQEVRRYLDEHDPGRVLLAEANQWPEEVLPYFGNGNNEFQMSFHFPLMPRIFMALRKGDVTPLKWILRRTPELPANCQWGIFLRNHDELTLEMVTEQEREWMWREYAPEMRMRLNLGIRRRLAPLLDNDRRKLELAYSLLFTMPGSPIIYYGDEIGMGDNIWLLDRNGLRTPMQWDAGLNAGFSSADPTWLYAPVIDDPVFGPAQVNVVEQLDDPGSLLNLVRKMIAVRKEHPAFGWGSFAWADTDSPAPLDQVAAYLRIYDQERLLIVQNLSAEPCSALCSIPGQGPVVPVNILTGEALPSVRSGRLELPLQPFQYLWLNV